jgi:Tol biopolymer transport system component
MRRHRYRSIALWPTISLLVCPTLLAQTGTTSRESVSSSGKPGNGESNYFDASADGRFIAFESSASNLVDGDTNSKPDIFIHDRLSGETIRASVSSTGEQANSDCEQPSISADGRYVVFDTQSTNLVPEDSTAGYPDVYLHDLWTGQTELVSWAFTGGPGDGSSYRSSISGDGRYVAFESSAHLLVEDTNATIDIYLRDMLLDVTTLVSVDAAGNVGNARSWQAHISTDGHFVAFASYASNLVPSDLNGYQDVFVRDVVAGSTVRASVRPDGGEANNYSWLPRLSADGRFVGFTSSATNLIAGGTNPFGHVFVRDLVLSSTEIVSVDSAGNQGFGGPSETYADCLSADGRHIVFSSSATNLVPGDTNAATDVFTHDRVTGETLRASVSSTGAQGDKGSGPGGISDDGRFVLLSSLAKTLVPIDTNSHTDVFVHDRLGCSPTIASYCTASTTSIAGCQALLSATGTPSIANASAFTVSSGNVPGGGNFGIAYFGVKGPALHSFGSQGGFLCVAQPFVRTPPRPSGGSGGNCDGRYDFTLQDLLDASGATIEPGSTVHIAMWFRDPQAPDHFSLSDGLWFQVCP